MTIREQFANRFGEKDTLAIEAAAKMHGNGINDANIGDPFKHSILIAIGYQCFEVDRYRESHGITAPYAEIKEWIKENAQLDTYQGDCDYLALMTGAYNDYMPTKVEVEK